jgi:hypothetical protein
LVMALGGVLTLHTALRLYGGMMLGSSVHPILLAHIRAMG